MIQLRLLGSFQVEASGLLIGDFQTSKVRALLAFLTLEGDRPHERELLANLLWPDDPSEKALANLRQGLHRLGQAFEAAPISGPPLLVTRQSVRLNPRLSVSADALQLLEAVKTAQSHSHRRLNVCQVCLERLRQAVALYRGELLAGFSSGSELPFDEWLLIWRERLREACTWALAALADHHERRGEGDVARAFLRRWIELEPWNEEAYRQLIAALARDGQRTAAMAQFERCRHMLARELNAQPSPETLDLAGRVRNGRLAVLSAPPHHVPAPETHLVGREAELVVIGAHLASPHGRLLTLTGAGGSGKTRLAIAVAKAERGSFSDGIFFVPLAAVSTPGGMVAAIAEALGLLAQIHDADLLLALRSYLRGRELLLILDNCEQLLDAAGWVAELLEYAPGLRVLATSRAPLRIPAEEVQLIAGLEVHPLEAEHSPAVQLFLQAAQRSDPGFAPGPEGLRAIVAICRAVSGLPLAILLAAGLINRLAPSSILALLRQDLDLLSAGQRGMPERHRSLRALFEGSQRLLGAAERHALAHVAIFVGPFSREGAIAVIGGNGPACAKLPQPCGYQQGRCLNQPCGCGTVQALESLAEHALLQRQGPGRFALHPLVRQFAAEGRATLPPAEQEASRARHRAYFLSLVEQLGDQIVGPGGHAAIEQLRWASDDIHLAWQDAVEVGDHQQIAGAIRGLLYLARVGGVHAASAADLGGAVERIRELDVFGEGSAPRWLLAELLVVQAEVAYTWGDYHALIAAAAEAATLASWQGRRALEAEARLAWSKGLWRLGDTTGARTQIGRASALARGGRSSTAGQRLRTDIHSYQGLIDWGQGHFRRARTHDAAALAIARSAAYRYGEGDALNNLALVAISQGAYREALAHAMAALTIYRATGNRAGEGLGLISQGLAQMYIWEDVAAQDAFGTSQRIYAQTGHRQNEGVAAIHSAMLLTRLGAYAQARVALSEGIALSRTIDHRWGIGMGLAYEGLLLHLTGDQTGAEASCRDALAITERAGDPLFGAYAATHLGHALASMGRRQEAWASYEHAASVRLLTGQDHLVPEPLAGLANLALERGDPDAAMAFVETILSIRDATGLAGNEEPGRIALVCGRALIATGDPRAAEVTVKAARQLGERLERLGSATLQQSLRAIPVHRELLVMASAFGEAARPAPAQDHPAPRSRATPTPRLPGSKPHET